MTDTSLGMISTGGAWAFREAKAKGNSAIAQKLIDAGLIILAKGNMTVGVPWTKPREGPADGTRNYAACKCSPLPDGLPSGARRCLRTRAHWWKTRASLATR